MMSDLVAGVIEQSVVAGGFLLLLHYFINTQKDILSKFAEELAKFNNTLIGIDKRLEKLEKRGEDNAS